MAVIRARRPLTAEVTATAPHSQLIGLTTPTYSGEVEGSDLELSRNDREAIRSSLRTATPSRCGDLPRRGSGMARLSNSGFVTTRRWGGSLHVPSTMPPHPGMRVPVEEWRPVPPAHPPRSAIKPSLNSRWRVQFQAGRTSDGTAQPAGDGTRGTSTGRGACCQVSERERNRLSALTTPRPEAGRTASSLRAVIRRRCMRQAE
jgi:hypothetical protein